MAEGPEEMGRHEQARWWMRTAEGDLEAARLLSDAGSHNLAAFHAQQAAEKSLKAVLARRGLEVRSHSATELLRSLRETGTTPPAELDHPARRLDLHYIQSRYPNGLGGDPTVYYDRELAAESIELAARFVSYGATELEEGS